MRLPATLAAAVLATAGLVAAAPSASAYCDPKYAPLCANDCGRWDPQTGVKGLLESLEPRMCPDGQAP